MAILITGGNRGLGFALASRLLQDGRDVILTARSASIGQKAAGALLSKTGKAPLDVLELDIANKASIDGMVERLQDGYEHPLECLVNNAGVYPDGWTQATWDEARSVNTVGPISLAMQMAPILQQGGRVVMVSSGYGRLQCSSSTYQELVTSAETIQDLMEIPFCPEDSMMQGEFKPSYKVTKMILNRATQILSQDPGFKSRDLGISACCPGWCSTDMGGAEASRTPDEGAASIAWLVTHPAPMPNGGFYRDGKPFSW